MLRRFVSRSTVARAVPAVRARFVPGLAGSMMWQSRGGRPTGGQPVRGGGGAAPPRGPPPPAQPPQEAGEAEEPPMQPPTKPEGNPKFITVATAANGVTTIRLNRAPVNSLNLDVFEELNSWLMWLSYTEECKGIVLSSGLKMVFSAGLDITELANPKEERFKPFWSNFQETWTILNSFPKPIVAAINGNAPAGGCILAISCDFRVMAKHPEGQPQKPYRIGLNETKIGIMAPPWVMQNLTYVIGSRKAEKMLQLGETPTAEEALALGLVDVVCDESAVEATAVKELEKFIAIPESARWMSRDMMRRELLGVLGDEQSRQYDVEFFWNMLQNPEVQGNINGYLARLSGKKGK